MRESSVQIVVIERYLEMLAKSATCSPYPATTIWTVRRRMASRLPRGFAGHSTVRCTATARASTSMGAGSRCARGGTDRSLGKPWMRSSSLRQSIVLSSGCGFTTRRQRARCSATTVGATFPIRISSNWIARHQPDIVLTGHIHQAPWTEGGSWHDRLGDTRVFNAGHQIGAIPAHIRVDTSTGTADWFGVFESESISLR